MDSQVDIQMPLKKGSFISGDVLQRFLRQDVPFTFYVDAGEDLALSADDERLLELITTSPEETSSLRRRAKVLFKRNRLRLLGRSPYIYLADADVLLPDTPVFGSITRVFEKYPQFGCVGVSYHDPDSGFCSVACGSMMLRRTDLIRRVGKIRGSSASCECRYIRQRLATHGLQALPLRDSVRAEHLDEEAEAGDSGYTDVRYQMATDGVVHRSFLEDTVAAYGTHFRLFIDTCTHSMLESSLDVEVDSCVCPTPAHIRMRPYK